MNSIDPDAPRQPKAGILLRLQRNRGWDLSWNLEDKPEEGHGFYPKEADAMSRVRSIDAALTARGYDVEFRKEI